MASPFPGMDPYIEACHLWEDFHHDLISEIKNSLALVLPKRYVARAGERSYVTLTAKNGVDEYRMQADISVARTPAAAPSPDPAAVTALLETAEAQLQPVNMRALVETSFRESFLEIREAHGERQIVTVIEVLSPSNKRFGSEGWFEYLRKRQACLSGSVNFVELDLLRGGRRMPMDDEWPAGPYYFLVCRKTQPLRCTVWPASFLRPLPALVVPLTEPDPDVAVQMQPLVNAIYARSQYAVDIDYHQPLRPPLSPVEQAWLEERLRMQPPG